MRAYSRPAKNGPRPSSIAYITPTNSRRMEPTQQLGQRVCVSGGTADQDESCAQAGIDAAKDALKIAAGNSQP